jgi:hypothetical protein
VLAVSLGPHLFHRAGRDVGQVGTAEVHRHLSRIDLGQQLQVPGEAQEALRVPVDHLDAMVGFRPAQSVLHEDLHVTEDRRQRCPELVREHADELVLQPVKLT